MQIDVSPIRFTHGHRYSISLNIYIKFRIVVCYVEIEIYIGVQWIGLQHHVVNDDKKSTQQMKMSNKATHHMDKDGISKDSTISFLLFRYQMIGVRLPWYIYFSTGQLRIFNITEKMRLTRIKKFDGYANPCFSLSLLEVLTGLNFSCEMNKSLLGYCRHQGDNHCLLNLICLLLPMGRH